MRLRENVHFVSGASFCGVMGVLFLVVFSIALAIEAARHLIASVMP